MTGEMRFSVEEAQFTDVKVMYIAATVPYAEMRHTRKFFMKLGLYAFTKRAKATSNVFIRYVGETPDTIDMEICFGVEEFIPETKQIKAKTIEAHSGKYAVGYYKGPREDLIDVYVEMQKWFVEQKLQRTGEALVEYYLNNPQHVAAGDLVTEIYWPIK